MGVHTTGVKNIEPVPVAPVAIPLCNLLDENGEYRPEDREGVYLYPKASYRKRRHGLGIRASAL